MHGENMKLGNVLYVQCNIETRSRNHWYDVVWFICKLQLGWHPVAAVQYTFTHKQYTQQQWNGIPRTEHTKQ